MTNNQIIINETLISLRKHITINKDLEDIIKLILENFGLSMQIELLREINERKVNNVP